MMNRTRLPQVVRSFCWDSVNNRWIPLISVGILLRITSSGLKITGRLRLHWININPSAKAGVLNLTDSLVSGATPVFGWNKETKDSDFISFVPTIGFTEGLYVETFTNISALNISYDIV